MAVEATKSASLLKVDRPYEKVPNAKKENLWNNTITWKNFDFISGQIHCSTVAD